MGLADLFRPKYRHSNVAIRTEAVRALSADDVTILTQVAKTDRDIGVRRIAMEKIDEADILADIAQAETERSLRELAGARAAELWTSIACSDDAEAATAALGGIIKLGDQHVLVDVAVRAQLPANRKRAFGELRDPRALAELAKSDAPQDVRAAAVARIDDGDVLRALAIDTSHKEVGLAAVDKLDDADRLENVASKAKNKAVRQRARKIVTEMAEAERAAKPGVPDDVKRRRAERAQLLREIEAHADSFDFAKTSIAVEAAESAWAAIQQDVDGDADGRFKKALARFMKRRELHEQQTRTVDELRAVERSANADKARAAAERAERAAAVPAAPVATPVVAESDEVRAAREADAKAAREDADARRAAQDAERAVKQKEDAERAVAVTASMTAMVEDLEKLLDSGGSAPAGSGAEGRRGSIETADGRVIERTLQQAARAAEQIGKLAAADRIALGDRYHAARGKLVVLMADLREAQDWERFANVPKAEALIAVAKEMQTEEPSPDLGNRLRGLQALWKEVGPMPQKRSKELWDSFKVECDKVYDKVRGVRAVESEKFGEVAKEKEALIAEAEALAESSDWGPTATKLKALQTKWKESGHLPRKQGDELWTRFRAACDKFFERRKPMLDAANAEEAANLNAKLALIARARATAAGAPGVGGWGKAIGEIKDVQAAWKEIGYVPRRDADRVYRDFRAACDLVFAKRDAARDGEANAHRAEIDGARAAVAAVLTATGDDVVAQAIAARAKAQELGVLSAEVEAMVRHVVTAHASAVVGTELDPAAARGRRAKLVTKAEELLPKTAAAGAEDATLDVAARLKKAMQKNAFGDLRWDGRDPVEVVEELRAAWLDAGPVFDEADRAQQAQFDAVVGRVLAAAGVTVKAAPATPTLTAPTVAAVVAEPPAATVISPHDAVTQPIRALRDPELAPPPPDVRARPLSAPPPPAPVDDAVDGGWDLGEDDPTAAAAAAPAPADHSSPPSSAEMAGDGATGGDGITDDSGWD